MEISHSIANETYDLHECYFTSTTIREIFLFRWKCKQNGANQTSAVTPTLSDAFSGSTLSTRPRNHANTREQQIKHQPTLLHS